MTERRLATCLLGGIFVCFVLSTRVVQSVDPEEDQDAEVEGRDYMAKLNKEMALLSNKQVKAAWAYDSNITEHNKELKLNVSLETAKVVKERWLNTIRFPWQSFKDEDLKRQFKKMSILGTAALPDDKYEKLENTITTMTSIYAEAKLCPYGDTSNTDCQLSLEPEISEKLAKSRSPDELKHYWVEWRNSTGRKCRNLYTEYVTLMNEAAKLNNFTDAAEYWLHDFEMNDFEKEVQKLWNVIEPLYMQLHAYVRGRLNEKYGDEMVPKQGAIPAHLLGNMWSQTWGNIYEFTVPFQGKQQIDVTESMKQQNYTPLKMFKLSDEFFKSLNLSAMPELFWNNSIIEKPQGRELVCHASAWDFYDGEDFRIKECTVVTMEDLYTVHHEMGHIQYYLQYKDQPNVYKEGANSGFHEAVGDTIALSVSTPKHMRKIGLLDPQSEDDPQADINFLFLTALDKIAFLPFGYLMDVWRWGVFKGTIEPKNYNCQWWNLRWRYQGIEPPVHRSEEDFDPGAKYHIVGDTPYIRYFVSFIIQFQFHRALCEKAGQFDPQNPTSKPLHQCDIYQSTEAGNALGAMLKMGSSKPWPDAMEALTGQRKMDASALMQYFAPLYEWLKEENKRTGASIGWRTHPQQKRCVKHLSDLENSDELSEEIVTDEVPKSIS
ncbi:angiotensin-converting enzyme-like isoform X2 [Nilaparvata lugens]|uniref:Angiotensin-converting enzyme n=1 Tax=Nilaparvata lugens TaxID=108931 RepID=A0A1I9WL53_NILLU|nr:angiotensin-converting enzyme-like isoform X2 [Nilaparvata lugens]APA33873.1 seminal fluid protein [Nilaparvata lugens]